MISENWLTAGVLLGELAHRRLQILPANKKATNNGGAPEIICQNSLSGCWCTADLVWLNIGQLQYQLAYRRPNNKFFTVCKPFANLILTLANQAPL
jgi:hypothetical protein